MANQEADAYTKRLDEEVEKKIDTKKLKQKRAYNDKDWKKTLQEMTKLYHDNEDL